LRIALSGFNPEKALPPFLNEEEFGETPEFSEYYLSPSG
jgi:hypothetical protein